MCWRRKFQIVVVASFLFMYAVGIGYIISLYMASEIGFISSMFLLCCVSLIGIPVMNINGWINDVLCEPKVSQE